jgi:hypothetical protein
MTTKVRSGEMYKAGNSSLCSLAPKPPSYNMDNRPSGSGTQKYPIPEQDSYPEFKYCHQMSRIRILKPLLLKNDVNTNRKKTVTHFPH